MLQARHRFSLRPPPRPLTKLLEHGIELTLLTRGGRLKGQLTRPKAKNVPLHMAQYQHHHDPCIALGLARAFVRGKITNGLALLSRNCRSKVTVLGQGTIYEDKDVYII